jgi:hypothetical protein
MVLTTPRSSHGPESTAGHAHCATVLDSAGCMSHAPFSGQPVQVWAFTVQTSHPNVMKFVCSACRAAHADQHYRGRLHLETLRLTLFFKLKYLHHSQSPKKSRRAALYNQVRGSRVCVNSLRSTRANVICTRLAAKNCTLAAGSQLCERGWLWLPEYSRCGPLSRPPGVGYEEVPMAKLKIWRGCS